MWHYYRQYIELPFTIHLPRSSLPVYTLGRVSKLSRLLHKEIKPSDIPINDRFDWWVYYLDERPPRGMLALLHYCYRDREGDATLLIVKVTSRPQWWCNASDQPEGDHTARSGPSLRGMQHKRPTIPLPYFKCLYYMFVEAFRIRL